MRHHLLVNDEAGSAERDRIAAVVEAAHAAGPTSVVHETATPDEVDGVLADLGDDDVLVVCGGDGSVHLAVERAQAAGRLDELTFAVVPLGTGNDLARSLGMPDDPVAALHAVLDGQAEPLDLIEDDAGGICVNALHAGIGVDAAERAQDLKQPLGPLAYALGAVAAGLAADGRNLHVEVDGVPLWPGAGHEPVLLVAVANAPTLGGGTVIAPDARPDDGRLDVVLTTATAPAARAAFGAAVRAGTHLERDDVVWRQGSQVRIRGEAVTYDVDGELAPDACTDRTFHLRPAAWRVVRPRRR